MKQRVSDFIADFLVDNDIKQVFTVVGGGAMYLNDSFGNHKDLKCIYNHHEQASAIAAESYARIENKMAVTCVTTGPGGTNALTGVLCAYQDNIPMLVISGQVRYKTTIESTGLNLRQFGEQEYNILNSVKNMTKYACMIKDPKDIKYYLQKAIYIANNGRKGPVWLDIPLDIQGDNIDINNLREYRQSKSKTDNSENIFKILEAIKCSKKPVILAGSAIRMSGARKEFLELIEKMEIPILTPLGVADLIENGHKLYFGNFGVLGGRAGNFIVQNSDLIISMGCRMSFKQVGFNYEKFAPDAKKIVIDIDNEELQKETINIDIAINANIYDIIYELNRTTKVIKFNNKKWINYCNLLKNRFTIYKEEFKISDKVNHYYFLNKFNRMIPKNSITVLGNSGANSASLQMGVMHRDQRLFANVNCGTMGYDLPAAIGAYMAAQKEIFCLTGDGSIQMNIQELQTIRHNNLPIKIIIFNNQGYQSILNTQNNFFERRHNGANFSSGISMPNFEKIANAYSIPYKLIKTHKDIDLFLQEIISMKGPLICEVIQDEKQMIEPRVKSKIDEKGNLYSPPIDDLYPFLPEEEYKKYLYI